MRAAMWNLRAALTVAAFCAGCSSRGGGFTPASSSDAAAPPPALHIHHEPGGRVFITGTPIECTPLGADGLPHPVVDECDVPLSHVQVRYIVQAQITDPSWTFLRWTVAACGLPAATLTDDTIEFHFVLELHKLSVRLPVEAGVYLYHTSGPGVELSQLADTPESSVAPLVVPV